MPFWTAAVPSEAERLLRAPLVAASRGDGPLKLSRGGALELATPMRVFNLRSREVADGASLSGARQTALRCLVLRGNAPVATADVSVDEEGVPQAFGGFAQGPQTTQLAKCIDQARKLDARPTFELRVLRIPELRVNALWLHSEDDDRVLLMSPTPQGLAPCEAIPGEQFLKQIKTSAIARAAMRPLPRRE